VKKLSGGFYANDEDLPSGRGPENGSDIATKTGSVQEDKTQQKAKQEEKMNEARARFLARKKMKATK